MKIKGVIEVLKINKKLKNDSKNSKNISRTFSGVVVGSVGSVHFWIVPWSSLYFSRSIGPFRYSQYEKQGFNLLHLSLSRRFPVLASTVCWSLQCLISAQAQGGGGGHFFRLTCSVVLWGGRNAANK